MIILLHRPLYCNVTIVSRCRVSNVHSLPQEQFTQRATLLIMCNNIHTNSSKSELVSRHGKQYTQDEYGYMEL